MKQKLLTLFALLVVAVTGAWAQTDPDLSLEFTKSGSENATTAYSRLIKNYETEGISLKAYSSYSSNKPALVTQMGGYETIESVTYWCENKGAAAGSTAADMSCFVIQSDRQIVKVAYLMSGNSSKDDPYDLTPVVLGWEGTPSTAIEYGNWSVTKQVNQSRSTAQWYEYDFSSSDLVLKDVRIYRQIKTNFTQNEENVGSKGSNITLRIWGVKVWLKAAGPTITTQPQSASYITGDPIAALTVAATASAGTLSYQWHSCDDALKTNPQNVGENSASYTPTAAGFYYVTVTDDNGSVDSDVAQITVSAASAPTISIEASETNVTAGTAITLTATAAGVPTPTLKWYVNTANNTTTGTEITGETDATYTFDAVVGTKYYYAIASNSQGNTTSNVVTITGAARTGSDLNQVVYSNGFDAFITDPDGENHGTIKAYYLEGTAAPTVASINASAGATYEVVGNTFTLTSEDEATSKVYDVTLTAVAPYSEDGVTFNGTEDWVVSAYGFCAESGKQGYRFQKTGTEGSADYWSRAKSGKTRMYFFLDANTSVTLANGGSTRDVKVYKNGTVVSGVTKSNALTNIPGEAEPYMLAIVSNQNGGDGALNVITITGPQTTATAETITPAKELTTYVPQHKLDFTSTDKLTAFIATATSATSVTLTNVDIVPAGTPIVVKATETASPIAVTISDGEADDVSSNKLLRGDGSTSIGTAAEKIGTGEGEKYDYILSDGKFYRATVGTVAPGKAYLHLTEAPSDAKALTISFGGDGETTGIEAIHNSQFTIHTDAPMYNLSGQRVGENYKGIVIVNGKKYMNK